MRTTAKRVLGALAAGAAVVMMASAGASAAAGTTATATAATLVPAKAAGWDYIGEFSKSECIALRDSYAGTAKCVRNAGGLYDLYVWV
ncbi:MULTISPECIES: hypothetical protein [Streptomyces]|uniref:hypothetical protein n=1 Tax=Streptomyces TaxID=1883 RepID=UPI001679F383|nr:MULTISPECIES: hypothetical protein [Streptomyces]MBK3521021.1 hypothetical protein [Streptomyces sp. MBT70]GGS13256.1 hypothetical protein GCM10010236_79530 [Streptomyces eurythermus]